MMTSLFENRSRSAAFVAAMLAMLVCAASTRNLMHHAPTYDELLHVLAARGLSETGKPKIADGRYNRAEIFTRAVAYSTRLGRDELAAARRPAWLGALALVAAVGVWSTRKLGFVAGLAASLLLAMSLQTLGLAVFARFYTLHALAMFIAFMALYEALATPRWRARAAYAVAAILALALAWHFQAITAIAVGAVGAGLFAGWIAANRELAWATIRHHALWLSLGALALLAIVLLLLDALGFLQLFRESALWAAHGSTQLNFYNEAMSEDWPLFWPLLGLATLAVWLRDPRLACTLAVIFAVAFIAHSLAAQKATRYLYYGEPFACVLLGSGFALSLRDLWNFMGRRLPRPYGLAPVIVLSALAFAAAASREGQRTLRLIMGSPGSGEVLAYRDEADWSPALPTLKALAAGADAVLTSSSMKALYYLGRYDYEINASVLSELDNQQEFSVDWRTGRQVISRPESVRQALASVRRALVIVEDKKLGVARGVPVETVAAIDASCARLAAPASAAITLWTCPRLADVPPAPLRRPDIQ